MKTDNKNINTNNITNRSTDKKVIPIEEMQDMISDYLFGTLNEYEKAVFEYNMNYYPEIIEEVHLFRTAFDEVNKTALEDDLIQRTKNMSYKVQQKLNEKKYSKSSYSVIKFLSPALGLLLIIVIAKYYVTDDFLDMTLGSFGLREKFGFENTELENTQSKQIQFFSDKDMAVLKNDMTYEEILDFANYSSNTLDFSENNLSTEISNDLSNIYSNNDEANNDNDLYRLTEINSNNPINFNNNIYNLNEEEMQYILSEM